MKVTPRIRAFLPGRPRLPAPTRAGDAPKVFRDFGRTLGKLDRAAHTAKPGNAKSGRTTGAKGGKGGA
ncbi:hypothetical protein LGR54_09945 [Ancylobacter sp. Lp-2]|uniref:hypothetical protein n=1 Tax=Ancylobacter sp. Lp-2 TaxID=2881339 RepID=UPI001E4905F3|nr:hypothetical protein [Ancylobacter sp. Lp-2]MCB4768926.1 hypothetical protein [Ancylobacter sp. Lp-2]